MLGTPFIWHHLSNHFSLADFFDLLSEVLAAVQSDSCALEVGRDWIRETLTNCIRKRLRMEIFWFEAAEQSEPFECGCSEPLFPTREDSRDDDSRFLERHRFHDCVVSPHRYE